MLFRQFVDDDLGCASYLVGCEGAGEVVVVDPAYAIEQYLDEAERRHARITRVVETHNHADHVSGHGRLALEHGARVSIHPAAEPRHAFDALEDGAQIVVGSVTLRSVHTPGHRPEHCAITVTDRARGDAPWLALTGDSLFVGDAARPDLAVAAAEGAEGLFHSLRRLAELPDGVEVYPGHVAGSLCGAGMSSKASSTIGFERRFNPALRASALDEFVAAMLARNAPRPPNMERIVELNRGPFLGSPAPLARLEAPGEAAVLDVRDPRAFAAGHLPGALNVPLSGSSFATRAGFVLDGGPVAIHAESPAQAERAARGLRAIAVLDLAGYVVEPAGADERLEPVELEELERLLSTGSVDVLDVREADERDRAHIAGSRHVPYRLVGALSEALSADRLVVTICETGARAAIAASVLAAHGVPARPVLGGGIPEWRARGGQTVEFRRCGS